MPISYCKNNHILVGLGGTGGKILKAFKMRMFEEFPEAELRNKQPVALLYVDSTDEMMGINRPDFRVMGMDASFQQKEFLYIKDVDVTHILDHIDNYPSVKGIVENVAAVRTAIGALGQAAGQKRRAGRLLFAANAVAFVNALRNAYSRCDEVSHNQERTNIHIFAGLAGGTGSGAVIDAITQTRKAFPDAVISVYAMIPEMNLPKPNMDQGRYYQNGYAALTELNALQADRFRPHDVTGAGKIARFFTDKVKGVADGLMLYSNVNENGLTVNSLEDLPKLVSDYVYARVFLIDSEDNVNGDIIRAYNFENMDDFALEFDETGEAGPDGKIPVARTKKINAFGIKRVIYPELRVLKHITYTIGEKILFQFKYNNWKENFGYVDEPVNKPWHQLYFNDTNLSKWMLDDRHLTLEEKILPAERQYPGFEEYWHDLAIGYDQQAKQADNPLNELDNILADFYASSFRGPGVEAYFKGMEKAIPECAREIRRGIEHELFGKWKDGDISITELQKISKLLLENIEDTRKNLDAKQVQAQENLEKIVHDRDANVSEWASQGFVKKKILGGNTNAFADHQDILSDYYTCRTRIESLEFARKLATRVNIELGKLDADISAFGQKINDAIVETERLITAQRKVNKGLEDMKSAIIEVSEEEGMVQFESDLKTDRNEMPNIARQLRESILPVKDFTDFGNLANDIDVDDIRNSFDVKLSSIVRTKHEEKASSDRKVLGLNILTQLRQKLTTDADIQTFALDIIRQSGVWLKLNNDQMMLHVRNNEGNLSPSNPASINKKTILISIPAPEEDSGLVVFADKLERAFKNSISQGSAQCTLTVNRKSPRKDELSIVTVAYCYPMRCISWLSTYKDRYEEFLTTGNRNTDASNAILLHSEQDGKALPSLFVVNPQEQPLPEIDVPVPPSIPVIPTEPQIQLFLAVSGKKYGPFDYAACKQLKEKGQLNEKTMVWIKGMMISWSPAGEVAELQDLFAPDFPPLPQSDPGFPPLPPEM